MSEIRNKERETNKIDALLELIKKMGELSEASLDEINAIARRLIGKKVEDKVSSVEMLWDINSEDYLTEIKGLISRIYSNLIETQYTFHRLNAEAIRNQDKKIEVNG